MSTIDELIRDLSRESAEVRSANIVRIRERKHSPQMDGSSCTITIVHIHWPRRRCGSKGEG